MLDINECSNTGDNNCHENVLCTNTNGSLTCQCENGYTGNGTTCNGKWFHDSIVIKEVFLLDINEYSNAQDNICYDFDLFWKL